MHDMTQIVIFLLQEKMEDRKSKDRQYNGQTYEYKGAIISLQNITQTSVLFYLLRRVPTSTNLNCSGKKHDHSSNTINYLS